MIGSVSMGSGRVRGVGVGDINASKAAVYALEMRRIKVGVCPGGKDEAVVLLPREDMAAVDR